MNFWIVYGEACKNPRAGFDCFAGLSCQDAITIILEPQSPARYACSVKAECP